MTDENGIDSGETDSDRSPGGNLREFGPILFANLLPVAGMGLLGWSFRTLFVLYWLDLMMLMLVYGGCSLFAQLPVVTEGRDMRLAWVAEGGHDGTWGEPSTPIHISTRLPPVYAQNARLLVPNLVLGVGAMLTAGGGILNFLRDDPAGSLGWLSELSSLSPTVLIGVATMAGSHCFDAYRSYFSNRRYERMSAHMVLEIPIRPILLLVVASAAGFIVVVVAAIAVDAAVGETAGYWTLVSLGVGGFLLVKITTEWGRFRAEQTDNPEGVPRWFTPEDPRDSSG